MRRILYNRDHKQRSVWLLACVLLIAVLAMTAFSLESYAETLTEALAPTTTPTASSYNAYLPLLMCNHQYPYTTLERIGLCSSNGYIFDYPLDDSYGIYCNYGYSAALSDVGDAEYVQMIMVRESIYGANTDGDPEYLSNAQAAAIANPGALWIIGNEPECPYGQGARTPEDYAEIYHRCYTLIKEADPTARVAVGGVVEPTPLRLEWLDQVLAYYELTYGVSMPVDVWTIHIQILDEYAYGAGAGIPVGIDAIEGKRIQWTQIDDMNIFDEYIRNFRQWMTDNGYRECELVVSEIGFLYPDSWFDDLTGVEGTGLLRIENFLESTCRYMLTTTDSETGCPSDGNLLVQRWMWYSAAHPGWDDEEAVEKYSGSLCNPYTHELNPLGEFYLDMVSRLTAEFDS